MRKFILTLAILIIISTLFYGCAQEEKIEVLDKNGDLVGEAGRFTNKIY
jgi:hypothetical protein